VRELQKLQLDETTARPFVGSASNLHSRMASEDVLECAKRLRTVLAAHQDHRMKVR
jgi:hypothetical protein